MTTNTENKDMKKSAWLVRIMAFLSIIVLTMAAYLLWARPYQRRWGATDEELQRVMRRSIQWANARIGNRSSRRDLTGSDDWQGGIPWCPGVSDSNRACRTPAIYSSCFTIAENAISVRFNGKHNV